MSLDRPRLPGDLGAPALSDPDSGGRVDDLGRHEVYTSPNSADDLRKIPGVVSRPMLGGLRTAHHAELLRDAPEFTGQHVELTNRRSVVILAAHESSESVGIDVLPSMRVPPVGDPFGRMCLNAQAIAAQAARA